MQGASSESLELNRSLHIAKQLAEKAEEGSLFFIEVSYKPLVSLFITTGELINNNGNTHSVHLRFVSEPHHYSEVLYQIQTMNTDILGFNIYHELVDNDINKLDYEDYKAKVDSVCREIDTYKSKYHGVCCYEDGDEQHTSISNVFILHICDIMNLLVCKANTTVPLVELKTNLLNTIDERVCIGDELNFITESNRDFFYVAHRLFLCMLCMHM